MLGLTDVWIGGGEDETLLIVMIDGKVGAEVEVVVVIDVVADVVVSAVPKTKEGAVLKTRGVGTTEGVDTTEGAGKK
jgi:hypothetical protein